MTNKQSNTDHLHEEGVINKDDLHDDHVKAIDQLSSEEVEHLKSISKKVTSSTGKPVGIAL